MLTTRFYLVIINFNRFCMFTWLRLLFTISFGYYLHLINVIGCIYFIRYVSEHHLGYIFVSKAWPWWFVQGWFL